LKSLKSLKAGSWEVGVAGGIIAYRLAFYPITGWWRDWVLILCLYWIFTVFASHRKAWPAVTLATASLLMAVYSSKQVPIVLDLLGRAP
jgi:hypothetical protein